MKSLVLICFLISCAQSKPIVANKTIVLKTCFEDRKDERVLTEETAQIFKISNEYLIEDKPSGMRYQACNLPDSYKIEGIKIVFSGILKEIFPYERRMGSPFVLTEISKKE